ncbi:MAG: hypothetical protein ACI395_02950 [Candidatus Cryptobacteroides sp.]
MRKGYISYIYMVSAAALLCGCVKGVPPEADPGTGDLVVEISSLDRTKAGTAADGDVMSNLHLWLEYGGEITAYLDDADDGCTIADDGMTATATFRDVEKGDHTMYVIANIPDGFPLDTYQSGSAIDDAFLNYVLPSVSDNEPPFASSGMPLSVKTSFPVGAGTNNVAAELVRTCAHIHLTVRNNTVDNTIILKDLALTDGNPQTGFLFGGDAIPSSASPFGPFKSVALLDGESTDVVIPHGGSHTYISQYMYETGTGGASALGFRIAGGLFTDGTTEAVVGEVKIGTKTETREVASESASTSIASTATKYLIKSNAQDSYIYYDTATSSLAVTSGLTADDIMSRSDKDYYFWTFTSTSTTTGLRNVGDTNKYVSIRTTVGISSSAVTFTRAAYSASGGFRFYYQSGQNYYAMSHNSTSLTIVSTRRSVPTDPSCYWQLYEITTETVTVDEMGLNLIGAEKYFDTTVSSLNYIGKYGTPEPLKEVWRNQDVRIVVNVHYNPASGVLYFETTDWEEDSNDTTFD